MATHETPNPDLSDQPKDIIYNILLRLRVKTLLRLKSVCKSWLSLISSPEFIETHLSISTNDPGFTHHRLLMYDWTLAKLYKNPWLDLWTCSVSSLLHEPLTEALPYNHPHVSMVGSSNGLFVVKHWFPDDRLFLWNPSTRERRMLPKLGAICYLPDTVYGFCYDESNVDFKLFAISPAHPDCHEYDKSRTLYEYKVWVYSLKSDCWRMMGDFPYSIVVLTCYSRKPDFEDGKFANGSLHWDVTPEQKKIVVSLDIKTETYREVLLPNFGDGVYNWTLETFGKSLSILCEFETTGADLWIMKECGVEVSWTKLLTIPYTDQLITSDSYLKPICISTSGDIMLNLDRTIVLYNSKQKVYKNLLPRLNFKDLEVYPFVESLVSPSLKWR